MKDEMIITLTGPSCSGKTFLKNKLSENDLFASATTATTRPQREGEPGDAYIFCDDHEFTERYRVGDILEMNIHSGYTYGTSKESLKKVMDEGKVPILVLDPNGVRAVQSHYAGSTTTIFSVYVNTHVRRLFERWLARANKEDQLAWGDIARRMEMMVSDELFWLDDHLPMFDMVLKNFCEESTESVTKVITQVAQERFKPYFMQSRGPIQVAG